MKAIFHVRSNEWSRAEASAVPVLARVNHSDAHCSSALKVADLLCACILSSSNLPLQTNLNTIVLQVVLLERCRVHLDNGVLHQCICPHLRSQLSKSKADPAMFAQAPFCPETAYGRILATIWFAMLFAGCLGSSQRAPPQKLCLVKDRPCTRFLPYSVHKPQLESSKFCGLEHTSSLLEAL